MNLQKAVLTLYSYQRSTLQDHFLVGIDCRAILLVTVVYLVFILSLPLENLETMIWFASYPIIMSQMSNQNYSLVFKRSLIVLPFILFIGIFNPIYEKTEVFKIGKIVMTNGWLSFITLLLRGILAMQALLIVINISGFIKICNSLRRLGLPKVLTIQLYMIYRYLGLLMEEAMTMRMASLSRGYGKKSFPLKIWTSFVGSLLIRSYERSKHIYNAMLARGYQGSIPIGSPDLWKWKDSVFFLAWITVFTLLYFVDLSKILFQSV